MDFLNPWWIPAVAAGLAVPALLTFYFLKLRRQEVAISSTLLWKQAIQDLQVNSPFQRLRNNLLLWLQLLALLIAAFCLWQPVWSSEDTTEKTAILLIDHSASMATVEADGRTRLERVKEKAKTYVDNLEPGSKVMLIAFADRARVASPFKSDKTALREEIDRIEQTEGASRLSLAMELAEAHSTRQVIATGGADLAVEGAGQAAEFMLFSDGRIEDAHQVVLKRGTMQLALAGQAKDNVGIIGLDARRNYERPEQLNVFVTVGNFGPEPVRSDLTIKIDGREVSFGEVHLGAAPPERAGIGATRPAGETPPSAAPPSELERAHVASVPFELTFDGGGVMEVIVHREDALARDNRAWVVIEPPRRLRVLLVTNGNYFLRRALQSLPLREVKVIDPEAFEAGRKQFAPGGRMAYDVAILDRYSPEDLPRGSYLFFGAAPKVEGVEDVGVVENQFIYDWDDQHPLLRHVVLNYVMASKWRKISLPDRAERLVEGETTPVVATLSAGGSSFVIVAFDLYDSNWPWRVSFPIFIYNAIQHLSASITVGPSSTIRPGQTVAIPVPSGADTITVRTPRGDEQQLDAEARQAVFFRGTDRLGVYRIEPSVQGFDAFAVNLLNPNESEIRPNRAFRVGSEEVETTEAIRRVNRPLWPWLMLAALGVLLIEWFVYNHRMRV